MQRDIERIRALCDAYRTEAKFLIIPSASMRTQILKTLGDHGVYPLNLTVKTLRELSYDLAEPKIKKEKFTPLDARGIADAMIDVLKSMQTKGGLRFFDKTVITSGIGKAMSGTVLELLGWGYLYKLVGLDKVDNKRKRGDLKKIVKTYVDWKKKKRFIDYTDVIEIALTALAERKSAFAVGCALEACEFNYLEERFFRALITSTGAPISASMIGQINASATGPTSESAIAPISVPMIGQTSASAKSGFVAKPDDSGGDGSDDGNHSGNKPALRAKQVHLFSAYGDYNEAKEVLRRIFQERIPFDRVLIVTPSAEPYTQLFYQLLQQYTYANAALAEQKELPITFGTGLPLLLSAPAKLLMLLLDWIGSGYRRHELIDIFTSGMFDINADQRGPEGELTKREERFTRLNVVNAIKGAGLTWQRRSYIPCLEKYLAFVEERDNEKSKQKKATEWLIRFVTDFFGKIPEEDEDGMVDAEALLAALRTIVDRYKRVNSPLDSQGSQVSAYELSTAINDRRVRLTEVVEIVKEHMRDIRILYESPAPGKIHLTTFRQAAWSGRENVFLIGLGADHFPGTALEDPLLLDHERDESMPLSVDRINKNIDVMDAFLTDFEGSLTCGYSSFDTIENRECYPSPLFRRLGEYASGEAERHAGFVFDEAERFVDENDYWLYHGINREAYVRDDKRERSEGSYGAPIWGTAGHRAEQVLSASSLSDYLQCKHMYFLKDILHLKEIREDAFDALGWLSGLETGNIYHSIFERFLILANKKHSLLADKEEAVECITKITEEEIAGYEEQLPTASEYHTERQKGEILDNAVKFVEYEVNQAPFRTVLSVEMAFGDDGALLIDLGKGKSIQASGKIDRVDRTASGKIEIVDYKTGSKRPYERIADPADAGIDEANAQLVFYYLALKKIARAGITDDLQKEIDISKVSYRFITEKGDYDVISLPIGNDAEKCYKKALLDLVNEIEKGQFPPEKGAIRAAGEKVGDFDCRYCGYHQICAYAFPGEEE